MLTETVLFPLNQRRPPQHTGNVPRRPVSIMPLLEHSPVLKTAPFLKKSGSLLSLVLWRIYPQLLWQSWTIQSHEELVHLQWPDVQLVKCINDLSDNCIFALSSSVVSLVIPPQEITS